MNAPNPFLEKASVGQKMMEKRASGILLHITSLPSKYGIGDLGPEAYKFANFLTRARQNYWQVLPLSPPSPRKNLYSPYNCLSAFAGNTMFISPDLLYRQGFLTRTEIQDRPVFPEASIDYSLAISYKTKLLNAAFERFKSMPGKHSYELFCSESESWLEDFALFIALLQHFRPVSWYSWPPEFRDKRKQILKFAKTRLQDSIERQKFLQYLFFEQWFSLKQYCNKRGIQIIGDIPIYVAYDSVDVWANPRIFKLTKTKKLRAIAGVPPDFFSRSGQLWGNPVYDWKALQDTGYRWWIQRIKHNLTLFDIIRLDHFRGFIAFWQVPANHKTAMDGKWVAGPKEDFFEKLFKHFHNLPIIIEDLGYITSDVRAFIEKFSLSGMRIILFAFDEDFATNPHCLHNHVKNCVIYTGTHDNNTARGWFEKEARPESKRRLFGFLGHRVSTTQVPWELIRLAMSSVGNVVILPIQDVLGLGEQARMNRPAKVRGNWVWRLRPGQITPAVTKKLARLTQTYDRG